MRYEQNNKEYDVFHKNHIYTTVFYDKHRRNNVTAVLQVSDAMENRLKEQYEHHRNRLQIVLNYKILI